MKRNTLVYHKEIGKRFKTATNQQSNGNILLRSKDGKYYKTNVSALETV